MAKFKIENTDLGRRAIALYSKKLWPFKSVTAEHFLNSIAPLFELSHNADGRRIGGKKVSAEAYMDRTMEATITMLKCIHKMEMESSYEEMCAMMCCHEGEPYNMAFLNANDFVQYSINQMYKYNNQVCDSLLEELQKRGMAPRYIDMESKRNYLIDTECGFAKRAAEDHHKAFKEAYKEINNLIKYGLPSETFIGQLKDKIIGSNNIKRNNKIIVDKILNSEADLEIVNLYVLPTLNLKIQKLCAYAMVEESSAQKKKDLTPGQLQPSNPYFFRKEYEVYKCAKESIEKTLLTMQKKELKLESDYKIEIKKDPETATYILTAEWARGKKQKKKKNKQLTNKINYTSISTKTKKRNEKSIQIKVGQSSNRLYEETKRRSACLLGYENRQELNGRKRSLYNLFSAHLLRRETISSRRTEITGQKDYSAKVSFSPAKVEDKVVYTKKLKGKRNKEKTLFQASVDVGNVSASASIKNNIPTVKANASVASAGIDVLGIAKANASAGSIGYSTDIQLSGKIKNKVFDQIVNENQKDLEDVTKEIAEDCVKKLTRISPNGPKANCEIELFDVDLAQATANPSGGKLENHMPAAINAIKSIENAIVNSVKRESDRDNAIDAQHAECVSTVDEAIDMKIFDIDFDKFPSLDEIKHYIQTHENVELPNGELHEIRTR